MKTYSPCPEKRKTQGRRVWTTAEVVRLCALYQLLLDGQREGRKVRTAPLVRKLAEELGRSRGSIEAKLMNISGCQRDLGRDFVNGYKPLSGYAKTMLAVVESGVC